MAPSVAVDESTQDLPIHSKGQAPYPQPLKLSGALEKFAHEDTTPTIGREFPGINIVDDLLNAENADELIRDLAITSKSSQVNDHGGVDHNAKARGPVSQRGVVFFRAQDNLTNELQKRLVHRLGQLSGKPADSTLHIHPILNGTSEFGVQGDNEISTISSLQRKKLFRHERQADKRRYDSAQWHSDIQFEPAPADYTSLRLTQLPRSGGDTLWASGYDLYDRFSPAYRRFFEGLTATFVGQGFIDAAARDPEKVRLHAGPRGSPANVGRDLEAVHPVVRTNPVTGWKSIFAVGPFPQFINELEPQESAELLAKFKQLVAENHDLQVRFKWRNQNDLGNRVPFNLLFLAPRLLVLLLCWNAHANLGITTAIWDNRSVFHSATFDYEGLGERFGNRAVGIGERPYLDPNSKSKAEALAE